MSADANTAYSLAKETGSPIEICKLALERSHHDIIVARPLLNSWLNKLNKFDVNDNTDDSIHIIKSYVHQECDAGALAEISCTTNNIPSTKLNALAQDIVEEIASYEDYYVSLPITTALEKEYDCNIKVRSMRLTKTSNLSLITTYVHRNNVGVIVETEVDKSEALNNKLFKIFSFDCALHIAAFDPIAINKDQIPLELKREVSLQIEKQLHAEGKAMHHWPVAIEGKLNKWMENRTLNNQVFIKSDKDTVDEIRAQISKTIESNITIKHFARLVANK